MGWVHVKYDYQFSRYYGAVSEPYFYKSICDCNVETTLYDINGGGQHIRNNCECNLV